MVKTFINKKYYIFLLFFIVLVIFLLYNKGGYIKTALKSIFKKKEGYSGREDLEHYHNQPLLGHKDPTPIYNKGQNPGVSENVTIIQDSNEHVNINDTKTQQYNVMTGGGKKIFSNAEIFSTLIERYNSGNQGDFNFSEFAYGPNGNFANEIPLTIDKLENIVNSADFTNWIKHGDQELPYPGGKLVSFNDVKHALHFGQSKINDLIDFNKTSTIQIQRPRNSTWGGDNAGNQEYRPGEFLSGDIGKLMALFKEVKGYNVAHDLDGGELLQNTKYSPTDPKGIYYNSYGTGEDKKYTTQLWNSDADNNYGSHLGRYNTSAGGKTMDDMDVSGGEMLVEYREKVNSVFRYYKYLQLELKRIQQINTDNKNKLQEYEQNNISINGDNVIQAFPSYGYPVMINPRPISFNVEVVNSTKKNINSGAVDFGCTFLAKDNKDDSLYIRKYGKHNQYYVEQKNKINTDSTEDDGDGQYAKTVPCFNGTLVDLHIAASQCIANSINNNRYNALSKSQSTDNKRDKFSGKYRRHQEIDDEDPVSTFVMIKGDPSTQKAKCILLQSAEMMSFTMFRRPLAKMIPDIKIQQNQRA